MMRLLASLVNVDLVGVEILLISSFVFVCVDMLFVIRWSLPQLCDISENETVKDQLPKTKRQKPGGFSHQDSRRQSS